MAVKYETNSWVPHTLSQCLLWSYPKAQHAQVVLAEGYISKRCMHGRWPRGVFSLGHFSSLVFEASSFSTGAVRRASQPPTSHRWSISQRVITFWDSDWGAIFISQRAIFISRWVVLLEEVYFISQPVVSFSLPAPWFSQPLVSTETLSRWRHSRRILQDSKYRKLTTRKLTPKGWTKNG